MGVAIPYILYADASRFFNCAHAQCAIVNQTTQYHTYGICRKKKMLQS